MFTVHFTFILSPDSIDKHDETRQFATKQEAWRYIKALDKRSRALLSEWSEADVVLCPFVPASQPLKACFVYQDGKRVFGWKCPTDTECEAAFWGRKHKDTRFFVTD